MNWIGMNTYFFLFAQNLKFSFFSKFGRIEENEFKFN